MKQAEIREVKKQNSNITSFRFAGVIGESILLQDLETKQFIDVKELENQYIVIAKNKNYLKLFDIKSQKLLTVTSYEQAQPANVEPGAPARKERK
jgi:hypothetical protein